MRPSPPKNPNSPTPKNSVAPSKEPDRPQGRIVYVAGFTGAGKSEWTRRATANDRRLLAWDIKGEWCRSRFKCRAVHSFAELGALCKPGARPGRIAFQPYDEIAKHVDQKNPMRHVFEIFARLAWVWCRVAPGTLIVEELADVTTTQKAPPAWGEILRKSRDFGTIVYPLTQRPAEADKTTIGNAAIIHSGMFAFDDDRKYMARCLDVPVDQVRALKEFEFIERNIRTRALVVGGGRR